MTNMTDQELAQWLQRRHGPWQDWTERMPDAVDALTCLLKILDANLLRYVAPGLKARLDIVFGRSTD